MSVQLSQEIEGVQTELLIQRYADRLMVIVTQLGKVGMLVRYNSALRLENGQ